MAIIIGLMSGTSADGVDAAAFDIRRIRGSLKIRFIAAVKSQYPPAVRKNLLSLSRPSAPLEEVMKLDAAVGKAFGATAKKLTSLLARRGVKPDLIASHGQTLHHLPDDGATLQIGSAAHIAAIAGVDVWSDFRRADMAVGGQGAPLAPAAHLPLFGHAKEGRVVVNIGGIANLTYIPAGAKSLRELTAFDTGPGNMLIDLAAQKAVGKPFDRNGATAGKGRVDSALLERALSHPYFKKKPPKSTGRDAFGAGFIDWLFPKGRVEWNADLMATLTELTVLSICNEMKIFGRAGKPVNRMIVCGGGAKNGFLMKRLASICSPVPVESSSAHGIDPGQVETALMAILGYHAANGEPLDLGSITGSKRPVRLGALTPAL